jgi:PAS domain S-box-containing protein
MQVLETLIYTADRIQIPIVIGSAEASGEVKILYANAPCAVVFGYPSSKMMVGLDVKSLMTESVAKDHHQTVADYYKRANGGTKRTNGVMDKWRDFEGVRRDGSSVPISLNIADIRQEDERYYFAVFYDRTEDVRSEKLREEERTRQTNALVAAQQETQKALDEAYVAKDLAEEARAEAERLKDLAEEGTLKQKRLHGQITLLRQIFTGTMLLVLLLGALVIAQWATGGSAEGLSMVKDILLVMTGILGSAMASVFDSRNSKVPD